MAVYYEWCVEKVLQKSDDIEDLNFTDSLAEAKSWVCENANDCEHDYRIVLVRTEGGEHEGVTDGLYAYLEHNGVLPEFFSNSYCSTKVRVPQKYQREALRGS